MDLEQQKFLFGSFFLIANKLQAKGDQLLSVDKLTTKQWFLTAMILQFKDTPPTLGDVANLMGTSHQNVKQLALKLAEKGFIHFQKDEQDGRITRLKVTDKSHNYWAEREKEDNVFIQELFEDLTDNEIEAMSKSFQKILRKLE